MSSAVGHIETMRLELWDTSSKASKKDRGKRRLVGDDGNKTTLDIRLTVSHLPISAVETEKKQDDEVASSEERVVCAHGNDPKGGKCASR